MNIKVSAFTVSEKSIYAFVTGRRLPRDQTSYMQIMIANVIQTLRG